MVTTFSSSLHRIQLLVDLAARVGRRVALVGRGVIDNVEIAGGLGRIRIPNDLRLPEAGLRQADPASVLCIVTGSQGEPRSALARIAAGEHRHVDLGPNDVVVFSAPRHSGQPAGHRPGHERRRAPGRRGHRSGHPAGARLGSRRRRRARRDALPGQAALLRADTWRVPLPRAPRGAGGTCLGGDHDGPPRRERAPGVLRRGGRLDGRAGRRGTHPPRRHAQSRRRRRAPGAATARRGRSRRAGADRRPANRPARRALRT